MEARWKLNKRKLIVDFKLYLVYMKIISELIMNLI